MRYLIILLIIIAAWFATPAVESADDSPHVAYIKHFLRHYPDRRANALATVPTMEAYAAQYGFPAIVPAVIIACESAWRPGVSGTVGEVGVMQVHGRCARGYDLNTMDGQMEAGIACLAMARDACDGSLRQAMTMYMSGSCRPRTDRTRKVVARRLWIIDKWSKGTVR